MLRLSGELIFKNAKNSLNTQFFIDKLFQGVKNTVISIKNKKNAIYVPILIIRLMY